MEALPQSGGLDGRRIRFSGTSFPFGYFFRLGPVAPAFADLNELLLQATRELLLNVVKHAAANHACVEIAQPTPEQIQIEVSCSSIAPRRRVNRSLR